jgi:hypothetical protein
MIANAFTYAKRTRPGASLRRIRGVPLACWQRPKGARHRLFAQTSELFRLVATSNLTVLKIRTVWVRVPAPPPHGEGHHEGYKRLTDPNYEPDLTRPEHVAISVSPLALPTFENLVTSGLLPPGTLLSPVDPERSNTIAEVTEDGFIQVGEHLCEAVDRAAREDHAEAGSGWEYWQAHLDDEDEPVTLADLRERTLSTA